MSEYDVMLDTKIETGKYIGHTPELKNKSMRGEQVVCSCGWESPIFQNYTGDPWHEWMVHMEPYL